MTNYQFLISAFDTAKSMSIVDIKLAIGMNKDIDCKLEGDMVWLINAGILDTTSANYTSGNYKYTLTAKGHCFALSGKCPLEASLRSKRWN